MVQPGRNRRRTAIFTLIGIGALCLVVVLFVPEVRKGAAAVFGWRADLIAAKTAGRAPTLSWMRLSKAMLPGFLLRRRSFLNSFLASDDDACAVCWDTPVGGLYGSARSLEHIRAALDEQAHGPHVYAGGGTDLRPDDVVLDLGAHLGTFTSLALRANAAMVVAVEPDPANARCLRKSFAREIAARRVVVVEAAAWDGPGVLHFESNPDRGTLGSKVDEKGLVEVRALTLDALAAEFHLQRVDFIKMDIEGSEQRALRGAAALIRKYAPRMAVCVYHRPEDRKAIPDYVLSLQPRYKVTTTVQLAKFHTD